MIDVENWEKAVAAIYEQRERIASASSSFDDEIREKMLKRSFRCSLTPIERGRIEVHLLFLRFIMVPDELPNLKRMEFSVLDLSWIASQNIKEVKKIITPKGTDDTEAIDIRMIAKRDPAAQKNVRKWLKSARKQIQRSVRSILEMEQREFLSYSPQRIWEALVQSTSLHCVNAPQKPVIQNLLVNWQGQIIQGEKMRRPLAYDLRQLCQEFSRYLPLPEIRKHFLMQEIPKKEQKNFRHIGATPWHIGWYDLYGTAVMSGIYTECGDTPLYGSAMLRSQPTSHVELKRLLEIAPFEVTVPLLCYGIFSVIKPFIPGYPARISPKDPFVSVIQKQKSMIFLSLTGPNAKALAELFFGAFTDYGEEEQTGKRLRQIQSRVHDGIVILNREYKNLQTFRNGAMLRDACIVLTNAAFEKNDDEIRLSADGFRIDEDTADIARVFPDFLVKFIGWFQKKYINQQQIAVREAFETIAKEEEKLCSELLDVRTRSVQKIPEELKWLRSFPIGSWTELSDIIAAYTARLRTIMQNGKFQEKYMQHTFRKIENFTAQAKTYVKKQAITNDDSFMNSFFNIKAIQERYPLKKAAYLQIALFVFRRFMADHPLYENIKLPQPWEKYLMFSQSSEQSDIELFCAFLSQKIGEGEIIPFRAERTANCYGWYDGKKDLIYLPYPNYYKEFQKWLRERNHVDVPSQRVFQQKLSEQGLLLLADNRSKSRYMRPDYRIVVDPVSNQQAKPQSVIKIRPDFEHLTSTAAKTLHQLAEQKIARRRATPKENHQ